MVDGTATVAVVAVTGAADVEVAVTGAADVEVAVAGAADVEVADGTVDGGAAAGAGEPEQAASTTSRGIALHDVRRFLTSS